MVTPVPIPNTAVKPVYVDGTAWETAWESRKPPGLNQTSPGHQAGFLFISDPFLNISLIWEP